MLITKRVPHGKCYTSIKWEDSQEMDYKSRLVKIDAAEMSLYSVPPKTESYISHNAPRQQKGVFTKIKL